MKMKKTTTAGFVLAGAGIGTIAGVTLAKMNHLVETILTTRYPLTLKDSTDYSDILARREEAKQWVEEMEHHEVSCVAEDELILKAMLIPRKKSRKWVILVHGYRGHKEDLYAAAKQFYEKGYQALCIECRGHGDSKAPYIGMGWLDRRDLVCWIEEILKIRDDAQIVLYGVSMGASAVMNATGEQLPNNVVCAIADCGFTSLDAILQYQAKKLYHIPSKPLLKAFDCMCKHKAGYSIYEASSIEQLKKSKTPTLFIHGKQDDLVPYKMVFENFLACTAKKDMIVVEDAGHGLSSLSKAYFPIVFNFIKDC